MGEFLPNIAGAVHRYLDQPITWNQAEAGSFAHAMHRMATADQGVTRVIDQFFGDYKHLEWNSLGIVGKAIVFPATVFTWTASAVGNWLGGMRGEYIACTVVGKVSEAVIQGAALVGAVPKALLRAGEAAIAGISTGVGHLNG